MNEITITHATRCPVRIGDRLQVTKFYKWVVEEILEAKEFGGVCETKTKCSLHYDHLLESIGGGD